MKIKTPTVDSINVEAELLKVCSSEFVKNVWKIVFEMQSVLQRPKSIKVFNIY